MKNLAKFLVIAAMVLVTLPGRITASPGAGTSDSEAFDKLKSMVGHWERQKAGGDKGTLDLELTAGGSAILERSSEVVDGKQVQMTTVYYLDGDHVQLTHYCMAGN